MTRFVLIAALLVAACKKGDSGPPCDKVVDHMQELMKQMMPGHGQAALGDRKQLIAQCEQRKMPASVRRCLLEAKTFNDLAACGPQDPNANQPPAHPTPGPSEAPAQPAPDRTSGTGSASSD